MSEELGIDFPTPITISVDNMTTVVYTNSTVKCSKIRHIDAHQDWVQAMQDSNICKLWKVHTLENGSDLLTKIHGPDQFRGLCSRCMAFQKILTEQPYSADSGSISKCSTDG